MHVHVGGNGAVSGPDQAPGAARRASRDRRAAAVTNGASSGTVGRRAGRHAADPRDLREGAIWIAGVSLAVVVVNSLTTLADVTDVDAWEPWVWEGSSMVGLLAALWAPWLATALAPPDETLAEGWRPRLRFMGVHALGVLAYSALHVGVFVLIREAAYALIAGADYHFGDRFLYEFRKDVLAYSLFVSVFWLCGYMRRRRDEPVRPVSFDIRDGARIIRAPLGEILAVASAGNYVEFLLADGRRPLMRATLAAVEVELERFGFVRAHRSWLVNAGRVTGLRPDGSGDWTVELGAVEAPLSRRYPQALERLKG